MIINFKLFYTCFSSEISLNSVISRYDIPSRLKALCTEFQQNYFLLYDEVDGRTRIRVFLLLQAVYLKRLIGRILKKGFVHDFFKSKFGTLFSCVKAEFLNLRRVWC